MSSDFMLICNKRKENYTTLSGVFLDEASMGDPWNEFSKLLSCSIGNKITQDFITRVQYWSTVLPMHPSTKITSIIAWLKAHKGEQLEVECW